MAQSIAAHIPQLKTISDFYRQLRIGMPQGDDFSVMRIEEQPESKRQEMPLFRCNFFRVVLFTNAGVAFRLVEDRFDTQANSIYFSYPGKLESWYTHQKIHGYLVCFTESFAHLDSQSASFDQSFPFFNFESAPLLQLDTSSTLELTQLAEDMISEIESAHPDRFDMIRLLLHQYLIKLKRLYLAQKEQTDKTTRNDMAIFNRFRRTLDHHFALLAKGEAQVQPSVSLMAERLNLNASYLNTTIKNLTGNTASSYIQEKTLLEIKSYLMHTSLQMAEISHKLGFTNVSYFNRFFKKYSGITPSAFKSLNS